MDFFFMNRDTFLNLPDLESGVPWHQELRKEGKFFERRVSLEEVVTQRLARTSVVFSHRWFEPTHPDPENVKLLKAQQFVRAQTAVDAVWVDWLCVPQSLLRHALQHQHVVPWAAGCALLCFRSVGERSVSCAVLCVSCSLLRFGEGLNSATLRWSSCTTTSTTGGSGPAWSAGRRSRWPRPTVWRARRGDCRLRAAFVCMAASEGTEAQAQSFMEKQWRHVTSEQAVSRLLGPDLLVTNKKDKEVQVHVLKSLNKQVAEFVSTFLTLLRAKLETLSPRDWLAEASYVGPLLVGLDLVADVVATAHKGNSRVSSSTREELVTFIRTELSRSTDLNLNSLFPVMVETLKLQHGHDVLSLCALPCGRMLTGCRDTFARVFSEQDAVLDEE